MLACQTDNDQVTKALGLARAKCSDGLFVMVRRKESFPPEVTFALVEFKGTSLDRAKEQLAETLSALREALQKALDNEAWLRARFVAIIVSDSAFLETDRETLRRFKDKFDARLVVADAQRRGKPADLKELFSL